jgi:type IV secretory pathway component VirB8
MNERQKQILKECERFGEKEVRRKLSHGEYPGSQDRFLVEGWVRELDSKHEQELESRREARDEEIIRIARSANRIAWAAIIIASILSTLSIIIAIIALCIKTS